MEQSVTLSIGLCNNQPLKKMEQEIFILEFSIQTTGSLPHSIYNLYDYTNVFILP